MRRMSEPELGAYDQVEALTGRLRVVVAIGVALVIAVGIGLRFWTSSALWLDEALTVDIAKLPEEEEAFSEKTSIFFKATRIYRMVDTKHNTLVYVAVSSKIVNGSPANAISTVPIMPWETAR